jgi:hypothetical protein
MCLMVEGGYSRGCFIISALPGNRDSYLEGVGEYPYQGGGGNILIRGGEYPYLGDMGNIPI